MPSYDLIIIGAGALGSGAAYHAARSGARTLVLEQFDFDHLMGSSHGASRIIRYAYDHPIYVQLARLAFAGWEALESVTGESLMLPAGGLDFGPADTPSLNQVAATLADQAVPFDLLTSSEANARFPQFAFPDGFNVLYQADSAVLFASRCVLAHLERAEANGAELLPNTIVHSIQPSSSHVVVHTSGGTFQAGQVLISAGAWINDLSAPLGLNLPLTPVRCQENYFEMETPEAFEIGRFPVFIAHLGPEFGYAYEPYGLPSVDGSGLKMSLHGGPPIDPRLADRDPLTDVIDDMRRFAARYLRPKLIAPAYSRGCLYTMTPDHHFIIDHTAASDRVLAASCCSGHGFKFSGVLGRLIVQQMLEGRADFDLSFFSAARFTEPSA